MDEIIVITGAASGIGAAIAELLRTHNYRIIACDKDPCYQDERQEYYKIDITDQHDIEELIAFLSQKYQYINGVINCAGIIRAGPLMEMTFKEIKDIFAVNLFGMFEMTKACFSLLLHAPNGRKTIVNISSLSGKVAFPFMGAYAMTKHAVEAFSDSLRRELSPLGIRVVIIEPGKILTPFIEKGEKIVQEKSKSISDHFYGRAIRFAAFDRERVKKNGLAPIKVAEKVLQALKMKDPKDRYLIVKHPLKTQLLIHLPPAKLDRKLEKI